MNTFEIFPYISIELYNKSYSEEDDLFIKHSITYPNPYYLPIVNKYYIKRQIKRNIKKQMRRGKVKRC